MPAYAQPGGVPLLDVLWMRWPCPYFRGITGFHLVLGFQGLASLGRTSAIPHINPSNITLHPSQPPPGAKRPLHLPILGHVLQRRHPLLDILAHNLEHAIRGTMRIRRPLADVAEPDVRHLSGEVLLREGFHGRELFPVGLPLDEVLVHGAAAVHGDLEPFCPFLRVGRRRRHRGVEGEGRLRGRRGRGGGRWEGTGYKL